MHINIYVDIYVNYLYKGIFFHLTLEKVPNLIKFGTFMAIFF